MSQPDRFIRRPALLEQLPGANLTDDDQYSPDLMRKRMFWLNRASSDLFTVVDRTIKTLGGFPIAFSKAYTDDFDVNLLVAPEYFPPEFRDRIKDCIQAAREIGDQKGFRWNGALMSPAEHEALGSTIWEGYHAYPENPVGVIRDRLMAEGAKDLRGESYTIEEADRGRRLVGMSRLDLSTGQVTVEIDREAATNSYIFLPPDQVEVVKEREAELQNAVEAAVSLAVAEHQKTRY